MRHSGQTLDRLLRNRPLPRKEIALNETVVITDSAHLSRVVEARRTGGPVLAIVGGAGGMSADEESVALALVSDVVVPVAEAIGACVIDGGTDSGVMRAIGVARARAAATFPLVGVAVRSLVSAVPGDAEELLEPNHILHLLVPGTAWGDESQWLADTVTAWASDQPSATLVINGGSITKIDVSHSVRTGRPVVLAAGTGRAADELVGQPRDGDVYSVLEEVSSAAEKQRVLRSIVQGLDCP